MPSVFISKDGTILKEKPFFARLNDFAYQIYLIFMLYISTLFTVRFDPQRAIEKYHLKQNTQRTPNTSSNRFNNNRSTWGYDSSSGRPLGRRLGSIDDIRLPPCGTCCGGN
ncbi:hypothetical protein T552_04118 [Pneumocystis carinii B80]|uniref:Uncharacterized protein n=1 Tax=Pneumocystis carinii (strain B80) TaxID=1408658 RepID=A0A0W4ZKL4_PNEC8|nr:hypothetical protein T552_04118 [Pneumocystis carinii B80]KTW28909.1 hypothetical protein T552_04118 [Pneumocystis carinii B80]